MRDVADICREPIEYTIAVYRKRKDKQLEKLQYSLIGVFFIALALIPWFLDHWWQLAITSVVVLIAAAAISNARDAHKANR